MSSCNSKPHQSKRGKPCFGILAAAMTGSAILCLTLIGLWIVSEYRTVRWEPVDDVDKLVTIAIMKGHFTVHWDYFTNLGGDEANSYQQRNENLKLVTRRDFPRRFKGFYLKFLDPMPTSPIRFYAHRTRDLGLDLWFPVLLLAIGPAWFGIRYVLGPRRERYRLSHGLCLQCGYFLKGTPEPRCPECGSEFDPARIASLSTDEISNKPASRDSGTP